MIVGSVDPEALRPGAPVLRDFGTEDLTLRGANVLQLLCEVSGGTQALLPPALHPTLPGVVAWQVYDFPESPWGPFRLAQTRLQCRSGTRPRGLLVSGVVTDAAAGQALAARWGFRLAAGEIDFLRGYDRVQASVRTAEGRPALSLGLLSPLLLPPDAVQFVSGVHPADTPNGFRLVQVDALHEVHRAERGDPVIDCFDAGAWGEDRIVPMLPISASICSADVTLRRLRFVCRPGEMSFTGTEAVAAG